MLPSLIYIRHCERLIDVRDDHRRQINDNLGNYFYGKASFKNFMTLAVVRFFRGKLLLLKRRLGALKQILQYYNLQLYFDLLFEGLSDVNPVLIFGCSLLSRFGFPLTSIQLFNATTLREASRGLTLNQYILVFTVLTIFYLPLSFVPVVLSSLSRLRIATNTLSPSSNSTCFSKMTSPRISCLSISQWYLQPF